MNTHPSLAGTTYERVYTAMVQDIVSGTLEAGARLKTAELSTRYDVSQMPVREALQRLQGEGLVTLTPNHGARVRSVDSKFIADVYELRAELIAVVYRDLFRFWRPAIVDELTVVQQRYDLAVTQNDHEACQRENVALHAIVNSECRNSEVMRVLSTQDLLVRTLRHTVGYTSERLNAQSLEHWTIIHAIRTRDLAAAISAARHHGISGGADVVRLFEEKLKAGEKGVRSGEAA